MKNFAKNIALWLIIGLLLIALFNLFQGTSNTQSSSVIPFSDFMAAINSLIGKKIIQNYLEKSGLKNFAFAPESGSPMILKAIKKQVKSM